MRIKMLLLVALVLSGATLMATDYFMEGGDPGRTGWIKTERTFTTANVGTTKLLWKTKLDNQPRSMHNLFPPLIAERVTTAGGPREIGVVAGVSDNIYGMDVATGQVLWQRKFDTTFTGNQNPGNDVLCPGGLTAVPYIEATSTPGTYTVYVVAWDGRLRRLNMADGQDVAPAEKFMPPNGKPYALVVVDGVVYTATSQGCGGVANGFYSFDLATRKASFFTPGAADSGDAVVSRSHPRRSRSWVLATARSTRPTASRQQPDRREARCQQAAAARRLLRVARCQLAIPPGPRHERLAGVVRLPQPQIPCDDEQGVQAVAARS